jgi:CheY-like chemotaxis protein
MPEQDGYSFMRRLRASGERAGAFIPALALTGHAGAEASRAALLAGFQMHVSKPLDPARLLDNLAKLWRRGVTRIP